MQFDINIEQNQIEQLFPFYFVLNKELQIIYASKRYQDLIPGINGALFSQIFKIKEPAEQFQYTFEYFKDRVNQLFILESLHFSNPLYIRGQLILVKDKDHLMYIGSPMLKSVKDLDSYGLKIEDFSVCDPVIDILQTLQEKEVDNENIKHSASALANKYDEHTWQNKENEILARFPEENPNPVYRISNDGIVTYANKSGRVLLNYLDTSIGDGVPEALLVGYNKISAINKSVEERIKINDSFYLFSYTFIEDYGYVNIYGREITHEILATQSLKESEERYKQLVEDVSDIIYRTDRDGKFTYVNPIALRKMQMSEDELTSIHFTKLIRDDYKKKAAIFYNQQIEQRIPITYFEFPTINSKGEELWMGQNVKLLEKDGKVIGFQAVARDITDRVIAEEKVKRSEEKYKSIIENLNLGLVEVDTNERITKAYDRFCEMLGYEAHELIGRKASEFLCNNIKRHHLSFELADDVVAQDPGIFEFQMFKKNGEKIWVLLSGSPLFDDSNNYIGSIGIHLDITERKRLEQSLEIAKHRAEASLKTKESFLANMSHEIRTPMNAILGMSKLLQEADLHEKHKNYIDSIRTSAKNLLVIINDILDLSKIEAGKLDFEHIGFRLEDVISTAIETVEYKATEKDLYISNKMDQRLNDKVYKGDPVRLNQILTNILSNAVKFTTEGEVKLSCDLINNKEDENTLKFTISDTGIGIDEDKLKDVFTSFSQADTSTTRKFGGTGLGLAICKKLVDMQGGDIEVTSKVNEGTTFAVTLTFPIGKAHELPKMETTTVNFDLKGTRLLLVEDHKMNQMYARSILEEHGVILTIAENGKEAVNLLKSHTYDVVLMDLQMPVMGGIEATQIIRGILRLNIPIIALTAAAIKGDNEKCLQAGMNDYLSKPFNQEDLLKKIGEMLNKKTVKKQFDRITASESGETSDEKQGDEKQYYNLSKVRALSGGNPEFVKKMLTLFIEETPKSIEKIKDQYASKNYESIRATAHSIKPSFEMLGIEMLKDDIKRIEEYAANNYDKGDLSMLIEKLNQYGHIIVDQIKIELYQ